LTDGEAERASDECASIEQANAGASRLAEAFSAGESQGEQEEADKA
jgi:hypothetical protein